jgi:hypothetical protein
MVAESRSPSMADLAWLNDPKMVIAFFCGSGGLGVFITWTYYAKQLRHQTQQLEEQKKLNAVQIEKMALEIKNLKIEKELRERELDRKKGGGLQIPTDQQVEKYAPVDGRAAYTVGFYASRAFAEQLKVDPGIARGEISIKSVQSEHDPTALQFGINDAISVTTEMAGAFYTGDLAARLLRWMHESKSSRVIIQTPFRAVEVANGSPPTEAELRQLLLHAVEP